MVITLQSFIKTIKNDPIEEADIYQSIVHGFFF